MSAYGSAVAYNAANPASPLRILALLAPMLTAPGLSTSEAAMLLLGMFLAASGWWVCLSVAINLLRSQLNPRMLLRVNQAAAVILTFYGALAMARSVAM